MTYTVKTFNQSKILQGDNEKDFRWFVSLPFTVAELGLSGNILLKEEDFNLINAKALVVKKIQEEIVRLAEHKEWRVTI